jgi:hypothetical protein
MRADGLHTVDGIGSVFSDLADLVYSHPLKADKVQVNLASLRLDKASLYLAHDLVLFAGPASYDELTSVLISMYGSQPYDLLKKLLGILKAAGLITSKRIGDSWIYRTDSPRPYLDYKGDVSSMAAAFRAFHLKSNPERFANA